MMALEWNNLTRIFSAHETSTSVDIETYGWINRV